MIRLAGWLTPATACALLTLLVLNSENAASTGGSRQPLIMAMLSNQSYAVSMTRLFIDFTAKMDQGDVVLNDEAEEFIWIDPQKALEELDIDSYTAVSIRTYRRRTGNF